jgi:hypothetical protein
MQRSREIYTTDFSIPLRFSRNDDYFYENQVQKRLGYDSPAPASAPHVKSGASRFDRV